MADDQIPAQSETRKPETASLADHQRWLEVVGRAQMVVTEKPAMALSSSAESGPAVSSGATVDAALTLTDLNDTRPKGDTPWTGEADASAVEAPAIVATGAGVGARSLLPERPWGNARLRLAFWVVASVILLAAAIVLIVVSGAASIPVWLVAIVVVIRALRGAYISELEQRIERTPRAARTFKARPPNSAGDGPTSGPGSGGGPVPGA